MMQVDSEFGKVNSDLIKAADSDIKIDALASENFADLYLFRVMSLKGHEDTMGHSQVDMRFQFLHPMIRKVNDPKQENFDWNISQDPIQEIHISRSTKRMMEIINNSMATIYERDDFGNDNG
jgi:hypothetical protein